MHLIRIGDRVINLQSLTLAELQTGEGDPVVTLWFAERSSRLPIPGAEGLLLWRYLTSNMHCKTLVSEPEKVD